MFIQEYIEIIGSLEGVLVEDVVDREWLMTCYDITFLVLIDIDHREGCGEGLAVIAEGSIYQAKLVGEFAAEIGFKFQVEGFQLVHHFVAGVAELQRIIVRSAATDGAGVGGFVETCVEAVVNKGQFMYLVDIPVELCQPFVVLLIEGETLVGACVVVKTLFQDSADGYEIGFQNAGGIGVSCVGSVPCDIAGCLVFALFGLEVDKVEKLVFYDRAAEGEACLQMVERGYDEFGVGDAFAGERIVTIETKDGSVEVIGSGFSDRIDAGACESGLCDVIGSDVNLDLIDSVQRDGLCICLAAGRRGVESERIIKYGSVQ